MKQALVVVTLLALAPVSAIAGGSASGDGAQAATAEKACAYHQVACATVERRAMSVEW